MGTTVTTMTPVTMVATVTMVTTVKKVTTVTTVTTVTQRNNYSLLHHSRLTGFADVKPVNL